MHKYYTFLSTLFVMFSLGLCAQTYHKTSTGLTTTINQIDIEIKYISPKIVRIVKSPHGTVADKKSFTVIKAPETTTLTVAQKNNELKVSSAALRTTLDLKTGCIAFLKLDGSVMLKETGVSFTPMKDLDNNTYSVKQSFRLDKDEAIYGLGQHQDGIMNKRNQQITLRQENMHICIPFFQSVKGYGLFWDNYSSTNFVDNPEGTSFNSEVGSCVDYYFMNGGNADNVIAAYRDLTGQAPMFPYWAFGYWQSRERYKSQEEIIGVVEKYRNLNVPLDGIIQDWQYWGSSNYQWNSTEFGNPLFPNPKGMIDKLHQLNSHVIISIWPNFGMKTAIYNEFKDKGYLINLQCWLSQARHYDPFRPEARDIYWNNLHKHIFSLGMDGWWMDASEPEVDSVNKVTDDNMTYAGTFRKVRNAFPLLHTGGVYDHQRQVTSDKRAFILTRSAFAGQQRYGTTVWSGDVKSSWNVLHNQIAGGLSLSLTGIPYWNTDIGGFFSGVYYPKGVADLAFQELYVRWLQFGTFSPMMRSHGTSAPREIYQFGKEGYWAYDAIKKFINLRYRLLPYTYACSWNVTSHSSTMMRALVMDFPNDKKVWDINNEYMFGNSILVCPVTDSLYTTRVAGVVSADFSKSKTKTVYLPTNTEWIDFWTGNKIKGGQTIEKEVPIDIMPLFVKAGSILPLGPFVQYANQKNDPTEIRVYPGANGTFTLYDDEKDNYNYEKGLYATITFKWNDASKSLTILDQKGRYPGMLQKRTFKVVLVNENNGIGLSGSMNAKTVTYDGKQLVVKL